METSQLKKFARFARRSLIEQVSAKLKLVLSENSAARRERADAVKKLDEQIKLHGQEQIIEKVAYTWFNRFCALRFMDVNRYTRIGVVSPAEGQSQPEILAEAKMGYIDDGMVPEKIRQQIFALLDGSSPSRDPQSEAYRLLVVAICNYWYKAMPFLFERIDDYTELLMPSDLLSGNSILASTRDAMTSDTCKDVEVIGWLYQFYISEKKDEVFAGLKKNRKITPENIPAATQLFTPHWIVRYLVENSLGRLWMLNRPNSKLVQQMEYYIKSEQPETDFLRINRPEELKICDPACGSGHMLTYAFDLLYSIYEEEGYEPSEIPEKILTHNLYGIEIDERAGELAAFALTMKARSKQRRFFRKKIQPNICVLENIRFEDDELNEYMDFIGRDLFTTPLQTTLRQFDEADNFGSLIRPEVIDAKVMLETLEAKDVSGQLFLSSTHQRVLHALKQADYLSPKYHVVIANPPYMGSNGMNRQLAAWVKVNYPQSKSDLFAMFIERNLGLALQQGYVAMITMQSWMFLSSLEKLRVQLLGQNTILSMAHLGARAFDSIGGEVVSTTAFVLENSSRPLYDGSYFRLVDRNSEIEKKTAFLEANENSDCGWFYLSSTVNFTNIPGTPIAYWAPKKLLKLFDGSLLKDVAISEGINKTTDNDRFIRNHWEVGSLNIGRGARWLLLSKGGEFRKWYGNIENIIDWSSNAIEYYKKNHNARLTPEYLWYEKGVTWTRISSGTPCFRLLPSDVTYETAGATVMFETELQLYSSLVFLNTHIAAFILSLLNPTLTLNTENIRALPDLGSHVGQAQVKRIIDKLLTISKSDWNSYETSWDFTRLPILQMDYHQPTLNATYQEFRAHLQDLTQDMQRLEEENNHIFIDAYGLQNELTPEVLLKEITLTCNPHYRYGGNKSDEELEALLLADTIREFISYAVGCMFGRYALDKPGLILANQGETIEDYLKQIPEPSFPADDDNVIPILDGDWFTDDITERFFKFLRITFGRNHYEENLKFIEAAIGKNIRNYFLKHFYNDHVKCYKKRPIYWLFSSPKGSFNALIYMHRYRSDTVSVVLNDYLREFRTKLSSRKNQLEALSISASAKKSEKARALKEIEKINKMIDELDEYEREVLYPLATEQVEIDLDHGVKLNYNKFGKALKKIPGLTAKGN